MMLLAVSFPVRAENSCECPTLGCDPCSFSEGVTFFTEKCGPRDSKVKSCARPTCIPLDQATAECPNPPKAGSGPREPVVIADTKVIDANEDKSAPKVGRVKVIKGSVSIVTEEGRKKVVGRDSIVRETETVIAANDSAAVVEFDGGNKMHVHPETEVTIKEFKDQDDKKARRALFKLIKGKIRNQVEQKYNGKTSYFKVETKGAVAGVRGTDFVITLVESEMIETRVETLDGKVRLTGEDESGEAREISRGEGATFTADPKAVAKNAKEFFSGGTLSPIYKINEDQLKELDFDSRVDVAKAKSRKGKGQRETQICKNPGGFFDQCYWHKADGKCVRQRCNGNGQWADRAVLPASGAAICPAKGALVKDCDY